MAFKAWGAKLLLDPYWRKDYTFTPPFDGVAPFKYNEDMYISGMGNTKINNLIGGYIEVYVCDPIRDELGRIDTITTRNGSELVYKKTWDYQITDSTQEYLWECVITWPFGFCVLHLFSDNGSVSFEFDDNDLITVEEYERAPLKYSFHKDHVFPNIDT